MLDGQSLMIIASSSPLHTSLEIINLDLYFSHETLLKKVMKIWGTFPNN